MAWRGVVVCGVFFVNGGIGVNLIWSIVVGSLE